jgi:hypothetical protein
MIPYNANSKKIRGWKRRVKQINAWGEQIKVPQLGNFYQRGGYTYERCILYPFYVLEKRQPPLWFYKLIVSKFLIAYFHWEEVFEKINVPYDLQLWIYDPNYMWSEIICQRVDSISERHDYFPMSDLNKSFPFKKFDNPYSTKFKWQLADEETMILESELEDEGFTEEELIGTGYIKKQHDHYGAYFAKRLGDVWVGHKKRA